VDKKKEREEELKKEGIFFLSFILRCRIIHPMNKIKVFSFGLRSRNFGKDVRDFVNKLPYSVSNNEYSKQLVRSSGSIGANYIEAGEGLSKKDGIKYMKISKKEAKESTHWLELIDTGRNIILNKERDYLLNEAKELFYILCSMVDKLTRD